MATWGPGDPEYDAWKAEQDRKRLAMTHTPTAPADPAVALLDAPRPLEPEEPPIEPQKTPVTAPRIGPDVQTSTRNGEKFTQHVETDAEKEAKKTVDASYEQGERLIGRATEQKKAEAGALEELAVGEQQSVEAQQQAAAEKRQRQQKLESAAEAELVRQTKAREGMKVSDYWDDKSTGAKVLAALSIGLGQIGAALAGNANNVAFDMIRGAVEDHKQRRREEASKADKSVEIAQQGVQGARAGSEHVEVEIANESRELLQKMEKTRAARMAAFGKTSAEIEGDGMIQRLRQMQAQEEAQRQTGLRGLLERDQGTTTTVDNSRANAMAAAGAGDVKDRGVKGPGGQTLFETDDPKRAAEGSEAIKTYREFRDVLDDLQASFKKYGSTEYLNRGAVKDRETKTKQLQLLIKRMETLGTLDKGSVDFMNEMVPQTGLWARDSDAFATIKALRERSEGALVKGMDALGGNGRKVLQQVNTTEAPRAGSSAGGWKDEGDGWRTRMTTDGRIERVRA